MFSLLSALLSLRGARRSISPFREITRSGAVAIRAAARSTYGETSPVDKRILARTKTVIQSLLVLLPARFAPGLSATSFDF
jgi:hypothetical protein